MAKPVINSAVSLTATINVAISTYTITATNTPTSFDSGTLPTGLSLNTSTGAITGTPTVSGFFEVPIIATNGDGNGSTILSFRIDPVSTAGIYNDGGIPIGGFLIEFTSIPGVQYIVEDFNAEESVKEMQSPDQYGRPKRQAFVNGIISGSGTLQLPNAAAGIPARGSVFSLTYRGASKSFVIKKIGLPNKVGEEIKATFDFSEVLNP